MNTYLTTHLAIALNALVLALILVGSGWYYASARSALEDEVELHMSTTLTHMDELAVLTDSNGANELTERIIEDCPRRVDFENLLTNLGRLTPRELITTQQLFESCGSFYAERKALMVAQLENEYASLKQDITYLSKLRDLTQEEAGYAKWEELIGKERERSAYLYEQTGLQRDILRHLIEGNKASQINELATEAQAVSESLMVIDLQIDAMRGELTKK
jgi:hypothetical protein